MTLPNRRYQFSNAEKLSKVFGKLVLTVIFYCNKHLNVILLCCSIPTFVNADKKLELKKNLLNHRRAKRANSDVRLAEYIAQLRRSKCATIGCGLIDIIEH